MSIVLPRSRERRPAAVVVSCLAALAAAVLLRWLLDPLLGESLALVTLFGAVAFAVWLAGYRAGLAVAILGYAACAVLFIRPRGELGLGDADNLVGLAAYLFTCILIVAFGESMRAAWRHADEDREPRRVARERAERLTAARELAAIVESSELAIVAKGLDGVIRSWNAAAERLFGYPAAEAIGRHISLVIPPERLSEEEEIIATLAAGGRIEQLETERVRADGRRILVSLSISPILDDEGRVVGASKMARDITRERRAEAEREKFVTLVESSTDFIGIYDTEGVPVFINHAGLERVGLADLEQARAVRVWDFFFPEDQERVRDELFPAVQREGHGELEIRFRHFETGEAIWMAYKVLALRDAGGEIVGYGTVSQDVTERRQLENRLRRLAADLSEADRRKDQFLATLAHELRGPLAPLAHVLEVWKRTDDRDLLAQARGTMERQLGQLVRLVDDLLDLNRITHDRLELRTRRVDLEAVLHQAVEACQPLADSLGHDLRVEMRDGPHRLTADPTRLAQVFGNLLNNACKYTEPGGEISVTAERDGAQVVVTVADTGTGIPPEQLDSIFDMFARAGQPAGRPQEGLGIGLTLVRQLVRMHGGTVEAQSAGPGRGSELVVRLPAAAAPSDAEPEAGVADRPSPSRRILVVDDNRDSAVSLSLLLELRGHGTRTAHDGIEAVETAESYRPEVILLDLGLPGIDGYEACRRIRREPWGREVTILAVTGWGQDEDRRKSREAGFDGHLVKPVDLGVLSELIAGSARAS
jgi:PAS domain S-box-containing protein